MEEGGGDDIPKGKNGNREVVAERAASRRGDDEWRQQQRVA